MSAPKPDHILRTGMGFFASKAVLSAVEMEVFTELAKGPETLETLTGRLGLHPRSSRDFLDTLVALNFWNVKTVAMRMRPQVISFSTSTSLPILAAYSRK